MVHATKRRGKVEKPRESISSRKRGIHGQVLPHGIGFRIPGLAFIVAEPHRTRDDAKAIAERIACDPASYMPAIIELGIVGITDLRQPAADTPEFDQRCASLASLKAQLSNDLKFFAGCAAGRVGPNGRRHLADTFFIIGEMAHAAAQQWGAESDEAWVKVEKWIDQVEEKGTVAA